MEDNKQFELSDEALDDVAGGRRSDGSIGVSSRVYVRRSDYACSKCGGNVFIIAGGDYSYYDGRCKNCETWYPRICPVDYAGVEHWFE